MKITQSLLLLASFSLSCNAVATVSKVASDVTNMIAQAKSLEQTFNGMNSYNWMIAGPTLHAGVASLSSGAQQSANDIMAMPNLPFSEADATTLFDSAAPFYTLAGQFLQSLVSRKEDLANLAVVGPISSIVILAELQTLQAACDKLSGVMMNTAPASLASNATELKATVDNALNSALDAYSA
ncbi:hypothetical protein BJ912DRAFT_98240 [Pholiota molesta]|nr:hypothetical protein BJ912DRAFT_98240 [Pholiota molesta]